MSFVDQSGLWLKEMRERYSERGNSPEDAIPVNHPADESVIINVAKHCRNCDTSLTSFSDCYSQELFEIGEEKYDRLMFICSACGTENEFWFKINPEGSYYKGIWGNTGLLNWVQMKRSAEN